LSGTDTGSVDEIGRRSRGAAEFALLTAGMLDKENRQVLDKLVEAKYCFSEIHGQTRLALPMGGAQPELRR
jgi:hypothetical protein